MGRLKRTIKRKAKKTQEAVNNSGEFAIGDVTPNMENGHEECIEHLPSVCCINADGLVSAVLGKTYAVELNEPCRLMALGDQMPTLIGRLGIVERFLEVNLNTKKNNVAEEDSHEKEIEDFFLHLRSRHMLYYRWPLTPGEDEKPPIFRDFVANAVVLWTSPWPDYNPPKFIYDYDSIMYTDADIKSIADSTWFAFNSTDEKVNRKISNSKFPIDRKSSMGRYMLDDVGRPINPMGRTGMCGRGLLPLWGPNKLVQYLITRENGEASGGYDFVAIYSHIMHRWMLPEAMAYEEMGVVPDKVAARFVMELVCKNAAGVLETSKQELDGMMKRQSGSTFYSGYLGDPRDTDNSWLEVVVVNIHDKRRVLSKFELDEPSSDKNAITNSVSWICRENKQLFASCKDLLVAFEAKHFSNGITGSKNEHSIQQKS